ncbi:MAG: serine/threonine protein kinase [Deltaproteobacteria bacterium]|nr:serine/threonine protein kinase [Deltaproteobacteria bacterium]
MRYSRARMFGPEPATDPLIGRLIDGKFEIECLIGRGGMGAVYRARQKSLRRAVAIKVLRTELLDDPTYAARFKREANAASQLDHPNLMRVIDFGEDGDLLYIAMELIDGRPLSAIMKDDFPLDRTRVAELIGQLLAALAVMHDARIVHRDLKPENVMVVVGRDDDGDAAEIVKLCDFGIAKQVKTQEPPKDPTQPPATATATLTIAGSLVGTPDYMAPEQAKGDPLDGRSDLYSVGVILYHMLTGQLPFKSSNSVKLLLAHINQKPTPPTTLRAAADPALEAICLRALEKDPKARFADAREMRAALRDALGLRESGVLGAKRAARASLAPPAPRPREEDVSTRRAPEPASGVALREPMPSSGTLASAGALPAAPSSGTLASPMPPAPPPAETMVSSAPPPPQPQPVPGPAPPANKTNTALIALVVVLLIVILVLVARR